jgi:hypothetical protein
VSPAASVPIPKPPKPKILTINQESFGYIKLKPIRAYVKRPIATINVFLNSILTVFFARVKPDSMVANPRCIINTKNIDTIIHTLLMVKIGSVGALLPLSAKAVAPIPRIKI